MSDSEFVTSCCGKPLGDDPVKNCPGCPGGMMLVPKNTDEDSDMPDARKIGEEIGIKWEDSTFTLAQFEKGVNAEMEEHHDDPETKVIDNAKEAGKVAWAHLKEDPKYYDKLAKMEESISRKAIGYEIKLKGNITEVIVADSEADILDQIVALGYKSSDIISNRPLEVYTEAIFTKIEEGTVTTDDFNALLEATPESLRDRLRRRPMAQRNTVKSHQDDETGHADTTLPKFADRVQPKREREGRTQMHGRGRQSHRQSARTQKRTMSKSLKESGRFGEAIEFLLEWYGKPFADYSKLLAEIEDKTAVTIVARRLMSKPGANRDWLNDMCQQMETL